MDTRYPNFLATLTNWDWYTGEIFLQHWLSTILDLSQPENQRASKAIAANFQSANKIAEIVNRHIAALSPSWLGSLTPLLTALTQKWERENAGIYGSPLKEATLKAKINGRSYLRLFFQQSYTEETMANALEVHCPPAGSISTYRNSDGFLTKIDYHYIENGDRLIERQFLDRGQTVFQIIRNDEVVRQFSHDLGGGFSIIEINLPALVTDSIVRNQSAINFALTLIPHNLVYSGWIQESILNAQPPGAWNFDEAGRERFTPNPAGLATGAGVSRFIQGLPIYDERQNVTAYTDPAIQLQQPIDPKSFIESYKAFSQAIYEQCSQGFVLGSDLPLSGVSREQSRRDFGNLIDEDAITLGYNYSDLLSVCNHFLGIQEKVSVKILPKIDRGIEHKKLVMESRRDGLISRRTAIEQLGFVADVEAELALLEAEEKAPASTQDASAGGVEP
jgi:hypothetical protein